MAFSVTFAAFTAPVMSQLDGVFTQVGNLGIIPGAVTGTNDLVFTPTAGRTPVITAYFDGMQIAAVAVATNAAAMTARVNALGVLNVYKDSPSGPVVCSGGEVINTNMFALRYNSALNAGAGGWHLIANTGYSGGTISGAVVINNNLSVASLASVTKLMVGASASSISRIISAAATLAFTVIPANTTQQQTLAVAGAQVNDPVSVGTPASVTTGTHFFGYVMAAGTVAVVGVNPTAASLVPVAGLYRVAVTGFT